MNSSPFILDSNFFIQAHRATYPFDVVPSFWSKIADLAGENLVVSIDKVREEIFKNDDILTSWCNNNLPDDFFKDSSSAISEYSTLAAWAHSKNEHYQPRAIEEFLNNDVADAWIIAFAINQSLPILSHEKVNQIERIK